MKPFGWGWLRGHRVATRITVNFIVTVEDMRFILAQWHWINRSGGENEAPFFLTAFQVERIIRRAYAEDGECLQYSEWDSELTGIQRKGAYDWAMKQLKNTFPEQYEISRGEGWL